MIRKPDAHDFRERDAVVAIRDAGTLAVEGARGVGQGAAGFVKNGMLMLFGFGFLMSIVTNLGPVGMLVTCGVVFAWWRSRRQKRVSADMVARWGAPPPAPLSAPVQGHTAAVAPTHLELSVGAVGRKAAQIGVPAILFFPTSGLLTFMMPFTLGAIVALALAILIAARLKGDRTVLRYDAETLTVRGLLGEATILWADVGDIQVRKAAFWDVKTVFTSGSRRNLAVLGRVNRLGGPNTLYIPIDLLGLDQAALARLLTRLLILRAGAPLPADTPAPEATAQAMSVAVPEPYRLDSPGFDPDAIMARYLAEREALIAAQRPDLAASHRATFGRKVA